MSQILAICEGESAENISKTLQGDLGRLGDLRSQRNRAILIVAKRREASEHATKLVSGRIPDADLLSEDLLRKNKTD
jgi:hypothetical protein